MSEESIIFEAKKISDYHEYNIIFSVEYLIGSLFKLFFEFPYIFLWKYIKRLKNCRNVFQKR